MSDTCRALTETTAQMTAQTVAKDRMVSFMREGLERRGDEERVVVGV